ncbi:MAG TPA: hypothetical protein VD926_02440 [Acidimicrobiales bacterium]|nr:hypothetical protein [Acidimicrobiales bacterium]
MSIIDTWNALLDRLQPPREQSIFDAMMNDFLRLIVLAVALLVMGVALAVVL